LETVREEDATADELQRPLLETSESPRDASGTDRS
jgi:hypothetical protein